MVYGVVPPLIVTLAVEFFTIVAREGLAIKEVVVAVTVMATVTVFAGDELSFTMMLAEPASMPATESVVPDIVDLTFVVSEFDFTEYGTLPPDIATNAVPPTNIEIDVGVAVNLPVVVSPVFVGVAALLQLVTKNITLAATTAKVIAKDFFIIMVNSMNFVFSDAEYEGKGFIVK